MNPLHNGSVHQLNMLTECIGSGIPSKILNSLPDPAILQMFQGQCCPDVRWMIFCSSVNKVIMVIFQFITAHHKFPKHNFKYTKPGLYTLLTNSYIDLQEEARASPSVCIKSS